MQQAWQAALVVLLTAIIARVAWELLKPLIPGIGAVVALIGVIWLAIRAQHGRW